MKFWTFTTQVIHHTQTVVRKLSNNANLKLVDYGIQNVFSSIQVLSNSKGSFCYASTLPYFLLPQLKNLSWIIPNLRPFVIVFFLFSLNKNGITLHISIKSAFVLLHSKENNPKPRKCFSQNLFFQNLERSSSTTSLVPTECYLTDKKNIE